MSRPTIETDTTPPRRLPKFSNVQGQQLFRPPDFLKDMFPSELSPEPEFQKHDNGNDDSDTESDDDEDDDSEDSSDETLVINLTASEGSESPNAGVGGQQPVKMSENVKRGERNFEPRSNMPTPSSTSTSFQSNISSQTSGSASKSNINDDSAEAWLQLRLREAEKKKRRTTFIPSLRTSPTPFSSRVAKPPHRGNFALSRPLFQTFNETTGGHRPNRMLQASSTGFGYFPPKKQVDKALELSTKWLEDAERALTNVLSKDPENKPCLKEQQEYQKYKDKFNRGAVLSGFERNRLREIVKNIGRRAHRLELDLMQAEQESLTPQNRGILDRRGNGQRPPVDEAASPPSNAAKPSIQQHIKPATTQNLSHIAKHPPQKSVPLSLPPPPQPTVEQKPSVADPNEDKIEIDDGGSSDSEVSESEEESDVESLSSFWHYHVFRREIGKLDGQTDPVYLSSFYSKDRAEEVVREEIKAANGSIWDRTRMEVKTIFEDAGMHSQVLTFASGREVHVWIEREFIEDPPRTKRKAFSRSKLNMLPDKFFVITEEVVDAAVEEGSAPSAIPNMAIYENHEDRENCEKRTHVVSNLPLQVWREGFMIRKHANAEASQRMLHHLTSIFPDENKFDLTFTGSIDTDARQYLHELDVGERLYDKTMISPGFGADGKVKQVTVKVIEIAIKGPKN